MDSDTGGLANPPFCMACTLQIPNFKTKYAIFMPCMFLVAFSIPFCAAAWQQYKLKG